MGKANITVKLKRDEIDKILKEHINRTLFPGAKGKTKLKVTHMEVRDLGPHEWSNNYTIDYIEYEVTNK